MELRCLSNYRSALGEWKAGQDVHVSDELGELLLRDSPGSFEVPAAAPAVANAPDRRARGGLVR